MTFWIRLFFLAALALNVGAASDWPLPSTRPEKEGFSRERLDKLHHVLQGYVDEGKHAGIITVIARHGKIVDIGNYGVRDLDSRAPMSADTIVRIYSMSKVITSVAALTLFEEGKFKLTDPISKYLPEFKDMKVCTGGSADEPKLVDAKRPITIKQLFTHTSGIPYDFTAIEPVITMHQRSDIFNAPSLKEFSERLARLPLVHQPGESMTYGLNIDVLGRLIEVVSGQSLEEFMQRRIFDPLKMRDTSFDVAPEKMSRLAKLYNRNDKGKLEEIPPPYGTYPEKGRGFASGGGGLYSTIGDYLRFGQMLLNGGSLDGKQILSRKTVELMTVNHLTDLDKGTMPGNPSEGFGLGGSVRIDLAKGNTLGSIGQFGWSGAASTTFNMDPKEQTVVVLLTQLMPFNQTGIIQTFSNFFYQSLVE